MRSSKYTREVLEPVVASSRSLAQVMRKLGLKPTGGNYRYINGRIRHLQLDTSHFGGRIARQIRALTQAQLEPLVAASKSVAQVLALLDLPEHGGSHRELTAHLRSLALDTSHFKGSAWSKGETRDSHPSVEKYVLKRMLPDAAVFVANAAPSVQGPALTKRLLRMGVPYACTTCGINEWRGRALTLHLGGRRAHRSLAACYTSYAASVMER